MGTVRGLIINISVAITVLTGLSGSLHAAKFLLDAKVAEAYSADGLFIPIPLPDYSRPVGFLAVYKIDYSIITNTSELASDELGFGNLGFSIDQSHNVADDFNLGWSPSTQTIDLNGSLPGGSVPLFAENTDAGRSNTDLVGILVSIGGISALLPITDDRAYVGQNGPTYIGSVHMLWDGVSPGMLSTKTFTNDPPMHAEFSALRSDGYFKYPSRLYSSTTIYFGNLAPLTSPEPTSVVLLFIGTMGFTSMRRR